MKYVVLMLVGLWLACGAPTTLESPKPDLWYTDPPMDDNVEVIEVPADDLPPKKKKRKPLRKFEPEKDEHENCHGPECDLIFDYEIV